MGVALLLLVLGQFEVASIRRHEAPLPARGGWMTVSGPRLTIEGHTVLGLIMYAYEVKRYQIVGRLDSTLYDVVATMSGGDHTTDDFQSSMRSLLADRFRLIARREVRDVPVYALVAAGRHKLKENVSGAEPSRQTESSGPNFKSAQKSVTTAYIADYIRDNAGLDRPVVDRTGLTGRYDFELTFTPEHRRNRGQTPDLSEISIFTAVQEQLGLRLERQMAAIEFVVVDHIEKPSEN